MTGTGDSSKAPKPAASQLLAKSLSKSRSNGSLRGHAGSGERTTNISAAEQRLSHFSSLRTSSWRGKAAAVAGLTQDISTAAANIAADNLYSHVPAIARVAPQFGSLRGNRKSVPSIAPPSCFNVSANGSDEVVQSATRVVRDEKVRLAIEGEVQITGIEGKDDNIKDTGSRNGADISATERMLPQAGWGGWWTKSADQHGVGAQEPDISQPASDVEADANGAAVPSPTAKVGRKAPINGIRLLEASDIPLPAPSQQEVESLQDRSSEGAEVRETSAKQNRGSWFGLWGGGHDAKEQANDQSSRQGSLAALEPLQSNDQAEAGGKLAETITQPPRASETNSISARGSGSWAFWSREQAQQDKASSVSTAQVEAGELAVAESTSPRKLSVLSKEEVLKNMATSKGNSQVQEAAARDDSYSSDKNKTAKTTESKLLHKTVHISTASSSSSDSAGAATLHESASDCEIDDTVKKAIAEDAAENGDKSLAETSGKVAVKEAQLYPNLVLPLFHGTYEVAETTTYMQQFMQIMGYGKEPAKKHIIITPSVPRLKHALAIGVHGLFPAAIVQKVLGQPTGTSLKFASEAAIAIQKWTSQHGYACEIEKIALEGEGLIADRVDTLWQLLLNWLDSIRKADFIMIACHSQGVPVAVMLMARLINLGCINPCARLGICAMAGVSLGPFPSYIGKWFGAAAIELFQFSLPTSTVSAAYLTSLRNCLAHHVRITYTGALNDQLVSLESAMFATISHPYIYRAVYVDGRVHAPDFLVKLIGLALKLRNLGLSDHGLIRELSSSVAGTLMASDGHSRVYKEDMVYENAVAFTLETTTLPVKDAGELLEVKEGYEVPGASGPVNPYFLPWAVRGVLEEKVVREGVLKAEADELLKLFEEWKPTTKPLKDVKFRLEAIRGQL